MADMDNQDQSDIRPRGAMGDAGPAAAAQTERRRSADVHVLYSRFPARDERSVQFSFRVANFPHIRCAFGEDIALEVLETLRQIASDVIGSDGTVLANVEGGLHVLLQDASNMGAGPLPAACQRLVEAFCGSLPMVALDTSAGPICLWVSGAWSIGSAPIPNAPAVVLETGETSHGFSGLPPRQGADWAKGYRADMARAARILPCIERAFAGQSGRLALFWQAVSDGEDVLYHEALLRWIGADGEPRSIASDILALERLGFARFLDRHVVAQVVAELEESPDVVLGVNISAQSVDRDCWWDEIEHRLSRTPNAGGRLFIEITETAAFPDISEAVHVATRMRALGCRIVLDGFGTGFASIRHVLALAPDLVKIDRSFLGRVHASARARAVFEQLVGLAQSLGANPIVEGVQTEAEADVARQAGGLWQQGSYWGRPAAFRAGGRPAPGDLPSRESRSCGSRMSGGGHQ